MPRPALTLKARALACIAQREHSRIELRRKLLAHLDRQRRQAADAGDDPRSGSEQEVDTLLDWLVTKDLLNPSRFVETRVRARASRFGNLRIHQELAQHGVTLDEQALSELRLSELARARAVWNKRFGQPATDAAEHARQTRFLSARGFSADVVRRVVAGSED